MPKYTPKTCTVPHINSEQYMLYLVVQTYSIQINADNTDQYRVIPVTYQIPTKHTICTIHAHLCTFEVSVHTTYSIQMNADNTDQYRVIPVTYQFLQNIPFVQYMPILAHLKFQCMQYIPTQIVNCESKELAI